MQLKPAGVAFTLLDLTQEPPGSPLVTSPQQQDVEPHARSAREATAVPTPRIVSCISVTMHKYIENPELIAGLLEGVREMRHKGTSIRVASQDPPSVPISLIELSSQLILHKFNSPAWLKHIQEANVALGALTPKMATLRPSEAFIWSSGPQTTRSRMAQSKSAAVRV